MDCPFQVGDEVVCVNAGENFNGIGYCWRGDAPVEGQKYTVTAVGVHLHLTCVWLAEIKNARRDGCEGYDASRFRKVERRNDSLSIEVFLTIKPGQFEEPKRKAPAKKRERA